jgi:hypothetical protein
MMGDLRGVTLFGLPLLPPQQAVPQQRPIDPSLGDLSQQYLDWGNYAFKRDLQNDPEAEMQLPPEYRENINPMLGLPNQMLADLLVASGMSQQDLPDYFAGAPSVDRPQVPSGYYDKPYWGDVPLPKPRPPQADGGE